MSNKILVNGLFYIVLTSFFIYIFINEKKIVKKISYYRDKLADRVIRKLGISDEGKKNKIKKIVAFIENITTALVLVLIIQRFYIGNFKIPTGSMIPTIEVGDRIFGDMVTYKFKLPKREDIIIFKEPIQDKVLYTKRAIGLPGDKIHIDEKGIHINGVLYDKRNYVTFDYGIAYDEWVVPKKGDKLVIKPAGDYSQAYKDYNIDIKEVQEELEKNAAAILKILPNLKFIVNGQETGMILDFIHDKEIVNKVIKGETVELVLNDDYILALGDNTEYSFDSRMWGFVASKRIRGRGLVRFWPLNRIGILK